MKILSDAKLGNRDISVTDLTNEEYMKKYGHLMSGDLDSVMASHPAYPSQQLRNKVRKLSRSPKKVFDGICAANQRLRIQNEQTTSYLKKNKKNYERVLAKLEASRKQLQ